MGCTATGLETLGGGWLTRVITCCDSLPSALYTNVGNEIGIGTPPDCTELRMSTGCVIGFTSTLFSEHSVSVERRVVFSGCGAIDPGNDGGCCWPTKLMTCGCCGDCCGDNCGDDRTAIGGSGKSSVFKFGRNASIALHVGAQRLEFGAKTLADDITSSIFFNDSGIASNRSSLLSACMYARKSSSTVNHNGKKPGRVSRGVR